MGVLSVPYLSNLNLMETEMPYYAAFIVERPNTCRTNFRQLPSFKAANIRSAINKISEETGITHKLLVDEPGMYPSSFLCNQHCTFFTDYDVVTIYQINEPRGE